MFAKRPVGSALTLYGAVESFDYGEMGLKVEKWAADRSGGPARSSPIWSSTDVASTRPVPECPADARIGRHGQPGRRPERRLTGVHAVRRRGGPLLVSPKRLPAAHAVGRGGVGVGQVLVHAAVGGLPAGPHARGGRLPPRRAPAGRVHRDPLQRVARTIRRRPCGPRSRPRVHPAGI